ncbi:MAG: ATP-dependent DNA helicase, partial [Acidimicrobiia bacterium]
FAAGLLREFGALVGVERGVRVIGPGFSRQLLHESLATGRYRSLDLTAPAQRVGDAALLSRRLAEHLATTDDLLAAAPENAGPIWAARIELAGVVERYETAKRRTGVVDYGDLVRDAYRVVATYPDVRDRIRSRYRLLVLDEYQDTDAAQRAFLRTLFGDGFAVTAVGDEDQMIYEWRGASVANFRSFPTDFPHTDGTPAGTLALTLNRRSGRVILSVANTIRGALRSDAALTPLRPVPGVDPGIVELHQMRTADEEAAWVATEIRRHHLEDGVDWKDMAVLFRKNRQIALVRDALEAEGVPLEVVSLGGLLDVPQVCDLHAWLRVLGRPHDSAALARILLGGRYRLGFADLAPLAAYVRARHSSRPDGDGPAWPLIDAIDRLGQVVGLSFAAHSRLIDLASVFRRLLTDAQALSLAELCTRILEETHAWEEIDALDEAGRLSARLNMYRFLDVAREWSPLEGRPSLDAFLGYLDALVEERAAEELDAARVSTADAVSLLTVHRAKGLEWDTVFVPAAAYSIFPASPLGYDDPADKPSSLPHELRLDAPLPSPDPISVSERKSMRRAAHDAGERRAAYVAVTRARNRLVISTAWWYTARKSREPSELFELAASTPDAQIGTVTPEPGPPPLRLAAAATAPPDPLFADGWEAAMRNAIRDDAWLEAYDGFDARAYHDAVEQFELMLGSLPEAPEAPPEQAGPDVSVTGLVTLAQCPRKFEWSVVDPLPRRRSRSQRRGVELHRRIELHNRGQVPFAELSDGLYDTPDTDPAADDGAAGGFAAFRATSYGSVRPRWTETPIDLRIGSGRIRGRIDAVYEDEDGSWEIVDFKSGRRSADPARHVQLQAYAVAAADGALHARPPEGLRVSFVYLGGGLADVETEHVDDAWLAGARSTLEGLLDDARRDTYEPVPGTACGFCDFAGFCEAGSAYSSRPT